MDHNRTEASIMSSKTIKSASYCPHIPQIIWDVHDTITPWIFAAFASIISPAAVLLNALVIIAVMKRRELQRLSNILLSSLAVTDLLVGAICIPLSAIDGFLLPYQILAAQHICTLDVATVWLSLTLTFCSLFRLVLIAWERYVAIRKWRDYRDTLTKSRLKKLTAIAWISGTAFVLIPFLISIAVSGRTTLVVFLVSTCFIVALIVYFYVMVYLEIRKRKFSQILQVSVLVLLKTECKVAKTTALVTAALFLSFVPAVSLPLLGTFFPVLRKMSSWRAVETLVLSNSLVNPLIYCYRDCRFKKVVLELLRIRKPKPKNTVDILRFTERPDVDRPLKDRVVIIQEVDENIRLTRSASLDLTRPYMEPNNMLGKRTKSAPLIHVGGISGEG